jgi:hypothetical protein
MKAAALFGPQALLKWSKRTPKAPAFFRGNLTYSYEVMTKHVAKLVKALEAEDKAEGMPQRHPYFRHHLYAVGGVVGETPRIPIHF